MRCVTGNEVGAIPEGPSLASTVTIKAGRSGAMYLWYGQVCLAVAFVSQAVLVILRTSLAVHLLAGLLCLPLLVIGKNTGLFVSGGVLTLRFGGFTRWSVPLAEVTGVTASTAPLQGLFGKAKTQPQRLQVRCGPRVHKVPADVMSYMFSPDPKESARLTAEALANELRSVGATGIGS